VTFNVRQLGVLRRSCNSGEVVHLAQREIDLAQRQQVWQGPPLDRAQPADLLISVNEPSGRVEMHRRIALARQLQPLDRIALDRHGQVVHRERTIRQPEVQYARHLPIR